MRAVAVVFAAVLLSLVACGGGAGPGADGSVAQVVDTVAAPSTVSTDELIDALAVVFDDDRQAIGAVLLAADRGYSLPQIVEATLDRRLDESGTIEDADGVVVPELTSTNVLVVEPAGLVTRLPQRPSQRTPRTWPLSQVIDGLERAADEQDIAALALLLVLLDLGYDVEQLTQAVVEGGSLRGDFVLLGGDGVVIQPVRGHPWDLVRFSPPEDSGATTTTTVTGTDVDDSSAVLAELVRAAVGTYMLGDELNDFLLNSPDAVDAGSEGQMTIAADGTISGSFSYRVTVDTELTDGSIRTTFTQAVDCAPSQLMLLDDGLAFRCDGAMTTQQDSGSAVSVSVPIQGVVDVELRQVVLLMDAAADGSFPDVRFSG